MGKRWSPSAGHVAQINLTVNVCTPAANTWDRGWGDDHAWLVTSCLLIPGRRPSRVYDCVFIRCEVDDVETCVIDSVFLCSTFGSILSMGRNRYM